jgi:multiple sugar transport system substrate-binding protein
MKGITWNHSRALPPLVATAQRFEELNPGARIDWQKRSLHEFGHAGLAELARSFDLLVVDHPMMGDASATGSLVDLKTLLTGDEWTDLEEDSIGASFRSYAYDGKLYALPIDAAAPAASLRPDLLEASGFRELLHWDEVQKLARRGLVRMPGFPADLFLNFAGMCVSRGSSMAQGPEILFDRSIALQCLDELRELASFMPDEIYQWNPIALYERMSSTDEFAYCPFAYTYSNYSRAGFGKRQVLFGPAVTLKGGVPMHTVLGGTGFAISKSCPIPDIALKYGLYVSGRVCQSTLYGVCGGQPARRSAWENAELNNLTGDFFQRTMESVKTAIVRPRYPGYVALQEAAGVPIVEYMREGGNAELLLDRLDGLYRESLPKGVRHD